MSVRVCYLERSRRGALLSGLRLVGERADEVARLSSEDTDVLDAAEWLAARVGPQKGTGALDALVLDLDGCICSWLSTPSIDSAVVTALARQGAWSASGSAEHAGSGHSALALYAGQAGEASVETLMADASVAGESLRRVSVMAVADTPARLLIDELDRRGVTVGPVLTFWQAMAHAWDRPLPGASPSDAVSAVVLIDPAGRLIWTWSCNSQVIAGGTIRLRSAESALTRTDERAPAGFTFGAPEASRLAAEWIAWAAQAGRAPSRVACVLTGDTTQAGSFGEALERLIPHVTVDAVLDNDPIGLTLTRLAERLDDQAATPGAAPLQGLTDLSHRPAIVHRRMFIWSAAAIAVAAVAAIVASSILRGQADGAVAEAQAEPDQWTTLATETLSTLKKNDPKTVELLMKERDRLSKEMAPVDERHRTRPVWSEFSILSLVLADPQVELEECYVYHPSGASIGAPTGARIIVRAPQERNFEVGGQLKRALSSIAGSQLVWDDPQYREKPAGSPDKVQITLVGHWPEFVEPKPATPKPAGGGS